MSPCVAFPSSNPRTADRVGQRRTPRRFRQWRSQLLTEERGAIALLAVFMAIFLAGTLFYVMGLAETVTHRATMQDAADATAFAAAVVHAKGMNAIVVTNLLMAAVLGVLVAIRMVETLALAAAAVCAAGSFFMPLLIPWCTRPAGEAAYQAQRVYGQAKTKLDPVLDALEAVADGLEHAMPVAAVARAAETGTTRYTPRATLGAAAPEALTLPVQRGKPSVLCKKAAEFAAQVALAPLGFLDKLDFVKRELEDLTADLAEAAPSWFCGIHDGGPARVTRDEEVALPRLAADRACLEGEDADACEAMARDLKQARPNDGGDGSGGLPGTGDCRGDCPPSSPYYARAAAARVQCKPESGRRLDKFRYQQRLVTRTYRVLPNRRVEVPEEERVVRVSLHSSKRPPCDPDGDQGWNEQVGDPLNPNALCTLRVTNTQVLSRKKHRITTLEVSRLFGCIETIEKDVTPSGYGDSQANGQKGKGQKPAHAPKALAEGVVHGGAPFQLRSLVAGPGVDRLPDRLLAATRTLEGDNPHAGWAAATEAGRVAFAQAEYYFDTAGELDEQAMWETGWTARLQRFQLPGGDRDKQTDTPASPQPPVLERLLDACGPFSSCEMLRDPSLNQWVVH